MSDEVNILEFGGRSVCSESLWKWARSRWLEIRRLILGSLWWGFVMINSYVAHMIAQYHVTCSRKLDRLTLFCKMTPKYGIASWHWKRCYAIDERSLLPWHYIWNYLRGDMMIWKSGYDMVEPGLHVAFSPFKIRPRHIQISQESHKRSEQ